MTSGWQEQIKNHENGFLFETLSVESLASCISEILSKNLTNKDLSKMGEESKKIASAFSEANYYKQIIGTSKPTAG
jgi:glycosyltransferase involved in cell wall biosynthesis